MSESSDTNRRVENIEELYLIIHAIGNYAAGIERMLTVMTESTCLSPIDESQKEYFKSEILRANRLQHIYMKQKDELLEFSFTIQGI